MIIYLILCVIHLFIGLCLKGCGRIGFFSILGDLLGRRIKGISRDDVDGLMCGELELTGNYCLEVENYLYML